METPQTHDNAYAVLGGAAADAEHCLARWMREAREEDTSPLDLRDFNIAVTALRRLIDARRVLTAIVREEASGDSPEAIEAEIATVLAAVEDEN